GGGLCRPLSVPPYYEDSIVNNHNLIKDKITKKKVNNYHLLKKKENIIILDNKKGVLGERPLK
ncbi:hypothetical protein, partial [uncultured Anaerococcus sp.]|uniref:hypothetical protein n=1 Tax=uncultured Anaerococcus sp. TaxID=293428 RepID=UPI00288AE9F1